MNLNHSHIPSWLANAWLFRKLFLLRKLFLTRNRSSHYGQMAEDVSLKKFFPKKYKGVYVDVGCFHPIKYSNTYYFYKRGWRGINVDIDQIKIEGFNMLRRKDINICRAVSDVEGEVTYYSNGFYTPTITLDKEFTLDKSGDKYQYQEKKTQAETLTSIIDSTKYKGQAIDILSVDVEGHDYSVLKSLDFNLYAPRIIAVESQYDRLDKIQTEDTYRFLMDNNYELVNWVGMTLVFLRKD